MQVHLVDGTYELFRPFFAVPAAMDANGQDVGAVRGVLGTVLSMIEHGATHIGVATDHVVESFRNDLYVGYKHERRRAADVAGAVSDPRDRALSLGVVVWPMVEFEADDALASAAAKAACESTVDALRWTGPCRDFEDCSCELSIVNRSNQLIRSGNKFPGVSQRVVELNEIQMRFLFSALLDKAAAKSAIRRADQLSEFGCPMDRGSRTRRAGSA
jgi:hypothetical protein